MAPRGRPAPGLTSSSASSQQLSSAFQRYPPSVARMICALALASQQSSHVAVFLPPFHPSPCNNSVFAALDLLLLCASRSGPHMHTGISPEALAQASVSYTWWWIRRVPQIASTHGDNADTGGRHQHQLHSSCRACWPSFPNRTDRLQLDLCTVSRILELADAHGTANRTRPAPGSLSPTHPCPPVRCSGLLGVSPWGGGGAGQGREGPGRARGGPTIRYQL